MKCKKETWSGERILVLGYHAGTDKSMICHTDSASFTMKTGDGDCSEE